MSKDTSKLFGAPIIGNIEWTSDFKATRDNKGHWTGSETFTVRTADLGNFIPKQYSACQYSPFEFMTCSGVTVENIEGNLNSVTVEYGGFNEAESSEFTDDQKYSLESSVTTKEEPIETHPKFKDVDANEKRILQNAKSGKLELVAGESYKYINNDDHEKSFQYEITSDAGKKLADYINGGVHSYLVPQQTLRCTYTSKVKPSTTKAVGKIETPPKTINLGGTGLNWLFNGISCNENAGVYTVSEEYILSREEGWDDYIYGTGS